MSEPWLTSVGGVRVERITVPHALVAVDTSRPPSGVGHTTEGGWTSSLNVFKQHYAPHFMLGRDETGRIRIAQFVPLGYEAASLENPPGGVETNRWARCQFELVGVSSLQPWLPGPDVSHLLAAFLAVIRDHSLTQIPLRRPFPDALPPGVTWATPSNPRRQSGKWGIEAGWYNHMEVPENDHWDMGAFQWNEMFKQAPGAAARRVAYYTLTYTGTDHARHTVKTTRPKIWQYAHPLAQTRGPILITPHYAG